MNPQELQKAIKLIEDVVQEYGILDAYLVGGYPRTIAMGRPLNDVHDLDVASGLPGRAKALAGFVAAAGHADDIHQHHRTTAVTVSIGDLEIDFQGSEPHGAVAPYVRLAGVEETPISMNIFDRDFTMNSLAIKVGTKEVLDITKRGLKDIKDKRVATIIPAEIKVPEDPLIITRAIRMSAKYGFEIDKELWMAMRKHVNKLEQKLSVHRLAIEAFVLSKYPQSKGMLDLLGIKFLEKPAMIEMGKEGSED
jgi:tRNA nucleotidyltransferase/poly(A) polymerase